jgi:hypothetical protein
MAKLKSIKYNVTFEPVEDVAVTAYEAVNDNIRSFVCWGESPADVLRGMADLLEANDIDWWSAATVSVQDNHGSDFYMVVYV